MIRLDSLLKDGTTYFTIYDGRIKRLKNDIQKVADKRFPNYDKPAVLIMVNSGYTVCAVETIVKPLDYVITANLFISKSNFHSYKTMAKAVKLIALLERLSKQTVKWKFTIIDNNVIKQVFTGNSAQQAKKYIRQR